MSVWHALVAQVQQSHLLQCLRTIARLIVAMNPMHSSELSPSGKVDGWLSGSADG